MNLKPVKPKATLLAYSTPVDGGSPERIVAAAAKLCYSSSSPSNLLNDLDDEKAEEFLQKLSNYGHLSPVEHISFTFGIEGISRACSHQIVRHRMASYSQQSQRYVDMQVQEVPIDYTKGSVGFVIPPAIENDDEALEKYILKVKGEFDNYRDITLDLEKNYLEECGNVSTKEKKAIHKKAIEDARYVLPNACETKLVMTMNARSLLHFFSVRCCNRAQWEIRQVADQMLELAYPYTPTIFENAGAPCISGKCPEGSMSCGKPKIKRMIK